MGYEGYWLGAETFVSFDKQRGRCSLGKVSPRICSDIQVERGFTAVS
jgi:hypothetical protein